MQNLRNYTTIERFTVTSASHKQQGVVKDSNLRAGARHESAQ